LMPCPPLTKHVRAPECEHDRADSAAYEDVVWLHKTVVRQNATECEPRQLE
jgi:hypothetical protein